MAPLEFGPLGPPPPETDQVIIDADSALDPTIALEDADEERALPGPADVHDSASELEATSSDTSSSASDVSGAGDELDGLGSMCGQHEMDQAGHEDPHCPLQGRHAQGSPLV